MLNGGKFYWTWEKEKGGNGKKYLCHFENEKFKLNVKNLGYVECELSLVCIDDGPINSPKKFDFYHDAQSDTGIEFYRIMDSVFSAANLNYRKIFGFT